jgi:nitrite reductase/ring-hydroxylating ferredoxin subunit
MADFDGSTHASRRLRINHPALVPAGRYYDEEFFKLEAERVWPNVWQMACRLEQIPEVGDWIEYSNVRKSVIVVRTATGVRAFHNPCRHRGVPIAGGHGNDHGNCATRGFICPFHGWRWDLDGDCTFVYGKQLFDNDLVEKETLALRKVRVELWGGCAFINHNDATPSLRETLGPVLDRQEAHGVNNLRSEWWYATVLPANWKIAMEAFMEGYHVMKTHPQLQRAVPQTFHEKYGGDTGGTGVAVNPHLNVRGNIAAQLYNLQLLCEGMAGMCHAKELVIAREFADIELPADPEVALPLWFGMVQDAIVHRLRERGEDVVDLNAVAISDPVAPVEFLFPHYFLLPFFTSMASYRIRPLGPESCLFEIWSLTNYAPGEEPEVPMAPTMLPYDSQDFPMIPRQDYTNIPIQQKGLHSTGFDELRLSREVEGLISNYQRIIDGHIGGIDPARLAAATQKLGGNFDGAILDLDI